MCWPIQSTRRARSRTAETSIGKKPKDAGRRRKKPQSSARSTLNYIWFIFKRMGHGLRKRAVPCAVPRAPRTGQAFLEKALRTIDLCPRPKDRQTTLEKTDNARTGAFALNESRPGAMTKPWRRSWGSPPSPKKRRNILNCHLYVKALNRIEGCFPNTESGAASAQTCRRAKKKNQPAGWERFARTGFMAKAAKSMDGASP